MGEDLDMPGKFVSHPEVSSLSEGSTEMSEITIREREDAMLETEAVNPAKTPNRKSWVKRHRVLLVSAGVLIMITASTGLALGVYTQDRGVIAQGVSISGVSVGNLSKEQAKLKLDERVKQLLGQVVKFSVGDQQLEVSFADLGLGIQAADSLEQAYKIGREGSIVNKATELRKATQGMSLQFKPQWDDKKLNDALNNLLGKFNVPAEDASFTINSQNGMDIKDSKTGRSVDTTAIAAKVKSEDIFAPTGISVEVKEEQPKLSKATLESQRITGLVSSYTTSFDASQANRTENLRIAAKALDGFVVKPGDTFSFNDAVGPRSYASGYKDAYVIVNGEFVPGLGGGICQVSSTLYNTLLTADLPFVERNNHSLAITYVPLGRDATVAYPSLDLKFKNDSGSYLLIRSKMQGNTLTFELYGQPKPDREVIITTNTLKTISAPVQKVVDHSLAAGAEVVKQAGHPGAVVSTTRIVKVKGVVTKTEKLGNSTYDPVPKIIATAQ